VVVVSARLLTERLPVLLSKIEKAKAQIPPSGRVIVLVCSDMGNGGSSTSGTTVRVDHKRRASSTTTMSIHANSVLRLEVAASTLHDAAILPILDESHAARIIERLGATKSLISASQPPNINYDSAMVATMANVPSLSKDSARSLLQKFGTIHRVVTAPMTELKQRSGFTEAKARKIGRFFDPLTDSA